ncbi:MULTISPECIES: hypothetical protein [Symbiopectobacterium]|uniref:hypothetical protein n=1 Tax=Symbiopectobacterium TaxID=801 RepID=UPI001A1A8151|nr:MULTISPECIES: hypothetical protein [Symbiopectobacterium]MBG6248917.1 hypothetical protein [Candidatus Symbiopectobacterium sp. PLON1]MBT9428178.1 hypothetical protein [Candidatus Symbiopectobacterium endolongispinus]
MTPEQKTFIAAGLTTLTEGGGDLLGSITFPFTSPLRRKITHVQKKRAYSCLIVDAICVDRFVIPPEVFGHDVEAGGKAIQRNAQ